MKKKTSLKKGFVASFIFALIFCFAQSAVFFGSGIIPQDLISETCSHDPFFEEIPMDFGYSFSVKKINHFKQHLHRINADRWYYKHLFSIPKVAIASWSWPQHGEYKFLFRFTPF